MPTRRWALAVLAALLVGASFTPPPNDANYPSSSPSGGPTGQWNLFGVNPVDQPIGHASGISADLAWSVTTGHPDVVIAILDSGVQYDHEDLRDKIWLNRGELPVPAPPGGCPGAPVGDPHDCNGDGVFNMADYAGDPSVSDANGSGDVDRGDLRTATFTDGVDDDGNGYVDDLSGFDTDDDDGDEFDHRFFGHGTGRAGIVAPQTNNVLGVAGVCPDCPMLNVRIDDTFVASSSGVAKGAIFAVDSGARVINMSLGATSASRLSRGAFDYATAKNALAVNAAANEFSFHHNFQSVFDDVMSIGAVTPDDRNLTSTWLHKANFSNYGAHTDVVGPTVMPGASMGFDGTLPDHAAYTQTASGTSSSTPHAAGVAALVFSRARELIDSAGLVTTGLALPDISAQEVRQILNRTAEDITPANATPTSGLAYPVSTGWDKWTGYGRVHARAAVDLVSQTTIPPEADINGPDWYSLVTGDADVDFYANARWASEYHYCLEAASGVEPADLDFSPVDSSAGCPAVAPTVLSPGLTSDLSLSSASQSDNHGAVWSTGALSEGFYTLRLRVVDDLGNLGEDRMGVWVRHADADDLPGFPCFFDGSIESLSTALADLDDDGDEEIVFADGNGEVHAVGAGCSELPGFPVRTALPRNLPLAPGFPDTCHATAPSDAFDCDPANGEVPLSYSVAVGGVAVGDLERDGDLEIVVAASDGRIYCWHADASACAGFPVEADPGAERDPYGAHASVPHTHPEPFAATPALGDLDDDGSLEIVVGSLDQKLYVWRADGSRFAPFPVPLFDPASASGLSELAAPGILSSAAIGDVTGDGEKEIVVGTNEVYSEPNATDLPGGPFPDNPFPGTGGSGRGYAVRRDGTIVPGWPVTPTSVSPSAVPLVAEGVGSSPALADLDGDGTLEAAISVFVGEPTIWNGDGTLHSQMLGVGAPGGSGSLDTDETTPEGGLALQLDQPSRFYVSQGLFADVDGLGIGYVAGTLGLRLLQIAAGAGPRVLFDHLVGVWDADTGAPKANFPRVIEDWQFITGPAVADVSGDGIPDVVATSGGYFVHAFNPLLVAPAPGAEPAGWPKLTGHWQTATPAIGDVDGDGDVEVAMPTRLGALFAWSTSGAACQGYEWRKFRHDAWNSGNYHTDARRPGRIDDLVVTPLGGTQYQLDWTAPGDDLACGSAAAYELYASSSPIDPADPGAGNAVPIPSPLPAGAAESRTVTLPAGAAFLGLRAIDEAGNRAALAAAAL